MTAKPNHFESVVASLKKAQGKKHASEPSVILEKAQVIQLPLWAESLRCCPNEILRSALFNARNHKHKREYLRDVEIAVIGDGRITYRGEELRQDDLTVWLQMMHLARESQLGNVVEFTPYSICKAVGWPMKGASYTRLTDCLSRMQATALSVYSKRLGKGVSVSMIPVFEWQDDKKNTLPKYKVTLAEDLVKLFGGVHYSRIEWEQRLTLPDGLATWLQGYYATHKEPFDVLVDTLIDGAGLKVGEKWKAKQMVSIALKKLVASGFLESFEITGYLVHVGRSKTK
jgi:hypothetical protein